MNFTLFNTSYGSTVTSIVINLFQMRPISNLQAWKAYIPSTSFLSWFIFISPFLDWHYLQTTVYYFLTEMKKKEGEKSMIQYRSQGISDPQMISSMLILNSSEDSDLQLPFHRRASVDKCVPPEIPELLIPCSLTQVMSHDQQLENPQRDSRKSVW